MLKWFNIYDKICPLLRKVGRFFQKNIGKGRSLSSRESIFAAWKKELTINN